MNDLMWPPSGSTARLSLDGTYRYELTRRWFRGPCAAFLMLNPSTADATVDDQTIRRCVGFASSWGMGAIAVANLYALRATNPNELRRHSSPVGPENDEAIRDVVVRSRLVVCAWGAAYAAERAPVVLDLLEEVGRRPLCLGVAANGQPLHPSRLRSATPLVRLPDRR